MLFRGGLVLSFKQLCTKGVLVQDSDCHQAEPLPIVHLNVTLILMNMYFGNCLKAIDMRMSNSYNEVADEQFSA